MTALPSCGGPATTPATPRAPFRLCSMHHLPAPRAPRYKAELLAAKAPEDAARRQAPVPGPPVPAPHHAQGQWDLAQAGSEAVMRSWRRRQFAGYRPGSHQVGLPHHNLSREEQGPKRLANRPRAHGPPAAPVPAGVLRCLLSSLYSLQPLAPPQLVPWLPRACL